MQRIIIVGASSGMGRELVNFYAKEDVCLGIIGRRESLLAELSERYAPLVYYRKCDASDPDSIIPVLEELVAVLGGLDLLLFSAGTGDLNPTLSFQIERPTVWLNVVGFTAVVDWAYLFFEKQKTGHLVVISSVAGLRGDGLSPAYNASKAYQINYMEGLRKKAAKSGVPIIVTDIRPGFVDTAMAKGEGLFWVASVEKAALQIKRAIHRKRTVVYITSRWKWVAFVLRLLPSFLYNRI